MGCDGGTIPKRDELVRTKKKKEKCSKEIQNAAKWNHCHLTQLPLQKPIVADMAGNLYNKESVIEFLLDKSKYEKPPEYVKTLKDVKELNLMPNPSFNASKSENGDEFSTFNKAQWICPITGLEMNGTFKFYFLWSCGCVFSERAYKTISGSSLKCLKCEKPFSENDLFIINPNEEEFLINEKKLKNRKEASASKKKNNNSVASSSTASSSANSLDKPETNPSTSAKASSSVSVNVSNGSKLVKKREIESDSQAAKVQPNGTKKLKSIQDDPNASDVFKSLFTSSDKAKNQQTAHWVTYNPQYF